MSVIFYPSKGSTGGAVWGTITGTLSAQTDLQAALDAKASNITVTGTRGSPITITAAGGVTPAGVARELMYVQSSGGTVVVAANPRIAAGITDGDELELRGRSDTNVVKMNDGQGVSQNGPILLGADWSILYRWDTVNWVQISRREN